MLSQWKKLLLSTHNTYSVYRFARNSFLGNRFCSQIVSTPQIPIKESLFLEPEEVPPIERSESDVSVLEEQKVLEDVSHVGPPIDFKSFNFAAFVNESEVLKKLVDLGVDFYTIERKKYKPNYLLSLDLDTDVAPRIQFLLENGLTVDDLGRFFTKNPFFFSNSLSNLQVRINYLESKKFDREAITKIIRSNPRWLNYSTVEIDSRIGYFQREFKMKGFEVRLMLNNYSPIVNCDQQYVMKTLFELRDVQEFSLGQCKRILVHYPKVWTVPLEKLKERLEYAILEMEIPKRLIVADPIVMTTSKTRLQNRHTFLKKLGRAQYDPQKPNYVTARALCLGNDAEFCQDVAKTSVETYNLYLKTI